MFAKICAVMVAVVVLATATATYAEDSEIHGFSFSTASMSWKEGAVERRFHSGHAWFIASRSMGRFEVLTILTPLGPPKYIQNFQLSWKNPIKGLPTITVGRTFPVFGNEWSKRIDRLPTINYSAINAPLVARDVGLSVNSNVPRAHLDWTVGVFGGQRTGGNVPISERGELDGYVRLIVALPLGVKAGASARVGPVPAFGADLSWQFKNLTVTGELITSKDVDVYVTAYHYLLEYAVTPRLLGALRFEHLDKGERIFTSGLAFKPLGDCEIKINYITSKQEADVFLSQLVLRW